MGDLCEKGSQLRPHIVWFGKAVTEIPKAIEIVKKADILVIIRTSLAVYPATGLVNYVKNNTPIFVIDPGKQAINQPNVFYIQAKAGKRVGILKEELKKIM